MLSETAKAALLGIVEGLTEFIPVSSTGHLILFGDLIAFHGPLAGTFEIFIQLGAILAVVVLYFSRFLRLIPWNRQQQDGFSGWTGCMKLGVACLPAFILGPLLHSSIKQYLFSPAPVAVALIVGGVVMILVEKRKHQTEQFHDLGSITYKQAVIVGLFQCLAMWPGISRSGATIIGGMLCRFDRKLAAEFSFLLAVPIMFAATAFDLYKSSTAFQSSDLAVFAVGFLVSFVTAVIAIRFFIRLLGSYTLQPFGYYRIVLGMGVAGLLVAYQVTP